MIGCAQCKSLQGIVGCSEVAAMMSLKLSVRRFEISIDFRAPALPAALGQVGFGTVAFGLLKLALHSIACCALSAAYTRLFNKSKLNSCGPAEAEGVQV